MNETIKFGLLCVTSFFTLINPLGVMPVFLSMTSEMNVNSRNRVAGKAVIVSVFIILAFAFTGDLIFNFFGISVNGFRVVGGVIFFKMGQDMLQAKISKTKITENELNSEITDISITPLAIPMICGPGAITNGIVLMQDATTFSKKIALIFAVLFICYLTYLILWGASKIMKTIGETGNKVMMRLMGLIVMVIAVEFFFAGLKPIIMDIVDYIK